MRRRHAIYAGAAVLVVLLLSPLGSIVGAQTNVRQGVAGPPSETQDPEETWLGVIVTEVLLSEGLLLLLAALSCGLFFAGVEVFDLWRERRAGEVARLHARIMTALQRDRLLKDLPVTPIVHPPLWGQSGGTIELRGRVPTPWLRYAVLRTAELEAARNMAAYHIDDRLVIVPSKEVWAA
jgi:hypothetical protein